MNKSVRLKLLALLTLLCAAVFTVSFIGISAEQNTAEQTSYYANNAECALVLTEYAVPDYNSSVKVYDPNGKEVQVSDNGTIRLLSEGAYRIYYGNNEPFVLHSLYYAPEIALSLDGSLENSYIAGSSINIPQLVIDCEYYIFDSYGIDVLINGELQETLTGYENLSAEYFFQEPGQYVFEYFVINLDGTRVSVSAATEAENIKTIFGNDLPDEIYLGNELSIGYPYGYYNGKTYDAAVTLKLPSGGVETIVRSVYEPYCIGEHEFTYSSVIDGETITVVEKVKVSSSQANFFFTLGNGSLEGLQDLPDYSPEEGKGWLIRSNSTSARFYYGGIVDLSSLTKEDNLIEFLPYSECEEIYMDGINITFTDIYDENRSVTVHFNRNRWGYLNSYLNVAFSDVSYGISNEPSTFGQLRSEYGSSAYYTSFMSDVYDASYMFNVQFDYAESTLYFITRNNANPTEPMQYVLLSLADSSVLPANYLFEGFVTGKVYVSFEFLSNNSSGIYVTEIAGVKAESLNTGNYGDNLIIIEQGSNLPQGVAGYPYKIPAARLSELYNGNYGLRTTVKDEGGNIIETENNSFTPLNAGLYTIEYYTEYAGIPVSKQLQFEILPEIVDISITGEDVSVDFGEYLSMPAYTAIGGTGELTVSAVLTLDGEVIQPSPNGKYFICESGIYLIEITATDFVGYSVTETFDVNITDGYYFDFEQSLPDTVKAGTIFTAPSFNLYYYENGEVKEGTEKSVTYYSNGSPLSVHTNEVTVPEDSTAFSVVFSSGGYEYEKVFDVLKNNITSSSDYFIGRGESITLESGIVLFTTNGGTDIKMPYSLSADNLTLNFGFNDAATPESITFVFSDPEYPELYITLKFSGYNKEGRYISLFLNGSDSGSTVYGTVYEYSQDCGDAQAAAEYSGTSYILFSVELDSLGERITDVKTSAIAANITAFTDGTPFNGFTDASCRLSFSAVSAEDGAEFIISQIGNHYFNYFNDTLGYPQCDFIGPQIVIYGNTDYLTASINDEYIIPSASAFDVLSGAAEVTVTVRAGGQNVITDASCDTAQTITLNNYGLYSVIYTAYDVYGNISTRTLIVNVKDEIAPTITVNGEYSATYRTGDTITIFDFEASDGESSFTSCVFIKDSSLKITFLTPGEALKLDAPGVYEIVYRAVDAACNATRVVYQITVQ